MTAAIGHEPRADLAWSSHRTFHGRPLAPAQILDPRTRPVAHPRLASKVSTFGWTLLFRRDLLLRIGGWDERVRIWQDLNLILRAVAAARVGIQVDAVLNDYRQDSPHRITHARDPRRRLFGRLSALRLAESAARTAPAPVLDSIRRRANHERYHLFRSMLGKIPEGHLRAILARVRAGPASAKERAASALLMAASSLAPGALPAVKRVLKGRP